MKKNNARFNKLKAFIEKNNAAFANATDAEKRVMIARDVLERVRAGQYQATRGEWASLKEDGASSCSIQKLLNEEGVKCQCCGIGSLFLSAVGIKNEVTFGDYINGALTLKYNYLGDNEQTGVIKLFGRDQLALIEVAFERGNGYYSYDNGNVINDDLIDPYDDAISESDYKKAKAYVKGIRSAEKRLVKIMNNIVRNNGTFVV